MASAGLAQDHWVATWAAAQQPYVATPVTPQPPSAFHNQTVRMIAHTSVAGQRARLHLSNAYGTAPLTVGAVHPGLRGKDSAIVAGADRAVTFSGKSALRILPGASVVSDAVSLAIPGTADLAVSVYIPEDSGPLTLHSTGLRLVSQGLFDLLSDVDYSAIGGMTIGADPISGGVLVVAG